jgi:hypothetical protein
MLMATNALTAYPDHNKGFNIYTDASDFQLDCAFLQESLEFPGIRRNLGSKKRKVVPFLQERLEKSGQIALLFCRNF